MSFGLWMQKHYRLNLKCTDKWLLSSPLLLNTLFSSVRIKDFKEMSQWLTQKPIYSFMRSSMFAFAFILSRLSFLFLAVSLVHISFPTHTESLTFSPFFLLPSLSFPPPSPSLSLPHLILMHGCIFGLCRDSLAPGGFSWNQFTLPVPSHWSTIYKPSTAGAAGRLFNRYIRCLTWQSVYGRYRPCFKHKECSA